MHQDIDAKLTSQISTTEITAPGEHDYPFPNSKLSNTSPSRGNHASRNTLYPDAAYDISSSSVSPCRYFTHSRKMNSHSGIR